jgi:hypothetical protein
MYRVQGIDEDERASKRQAGIKRTPAEAVQQSRLAGARKTRFS